MCSFKYLKLFIYFSYIHMSKYPLAFCKCVTMLHKCCRLCEFSYFANYGAHALGTI